MSFFRYTPYQHLWLFFIYAFMGWCCEIAYCGIKEKHFVNRGFLNGPWCPIYGFAASFMVSIFTPVEHNLLVLYISACVACAAMELFTGMMLENIYHARWWDYRDKKFNIMGYVCLEFSLIWGLAGIILIKLVNPLMIMLVRHFSNIVGYIAAGFISAVFISDFVITVLTIHKMQHIIKYADEITERIRTVTERIALCVYHNAVKAERLGEEIAQREDVRDFADSTEMFKRVLRQDKEWNISKIRADHKEMLEDFAEKLSVIKNRYEEFKAERGEDIDELREKLEELRAKYENTMSRRGMLYKRIIDAFPSLDFMMHHDMFEKFKNRFKE